MYITCMFIKDLRCLIETHITMKLKFIRQTVKCPGQELNLNFNYLGCVIPLDHQDWNETDFEN